MLGIKLIEKETNAKGKVHVVPRVLVQCLNLTPIDECMDLTHNEMFLTQG